MKNYFKLFLVFLIVASCANENDISSEDELGLPEQSRALFESPEFDKLVNSFPNLDQTEMNLSLEEHDVHGKLFYSMNLDTERKVLFAIEDGELLNQPVIIETIINNKSDQLKFSVSDINNNTLEEIEIKETNGEPSITTQSRGNCIEDCVRETLEECLEQGVEVIIACGITIQILFGVCTLRCAFNF